ncbi:hypothetical protein HQ560_04775, partial [bacterium]|nr:hypothetical protein [bacterium]
LPWVYLIILGILGVGAAVLNALPQLALPLRMRIGLALLRILGFGLLALMLFQLELRLTFARDLLPRVAILTDTSASMGIADQEGAPRVAAAQAFAQEIASDVAGRAQISQYHFDWTLRPATEDKGDVQASGLTRIPGSLHQLVQREENVQAIVLLTDGNDTGGDKGLAIAPLLAARDAPVYPVTFGQPTAPRRGQVRVAGASRYVRLGDDLILDALLEANLEGENTVRASLYQGKGAVALTTRENIRLGEAPVPIRFVIRPRRAGRTTYRIMLEGLPSAESGQRLVAEHTVDVIDAPIRILYLDIPRDERKFLSHWLARDPIVDVATLTLMPKGGWYGQGRLVHANAGDGIPNREADLYKYDVIILGDIPRAAWRAGGDVAETKLRWLAEFVARRGGGLVTLGGRSAYAAGQYQGSALADLIPFQMEATDTPQVKKTFLLAPTPLGLAHPILQLDGDPALNREAWFDLPRLEGCNRVGLPKPSATLLAVRQEGEEQLPLMAIHNVGKGKVLSLAMDTTWRWEMARELEAPDHYRRFWGNIARHLAPDPRLVPGRPRIRRSQSHYALGETVDLAIQLVDDVYRPVRDADLRIDVERPSGTSFAIYPRDGRDHAGQYRFAIELNEAGPWTLRATQGKHQSEETLVAGESQDEMEDPRARPERMAALAEASGGKAFAPAQKEALLAALRLRQHSVVETRTVALWNLPVLLLLFLACVTVDCLWRKRRGLV